MSHTADRPHDGRDLNRDGRDDARTDATPRDAGHPRETGRKHAAGAFDIRNIIGLLLLIYGLLLTLYSFVGDKALDKTGDVNANLWAGLGLLLIGALFMAWAKARPILVPEHVDHDDDRPRAH